MKFFFHFPHLLKRGGLILWAGILLAYSAGCTPTQETPDHRSDQSLKVIAVETFLADIAGQIAGDRMPVESLAPLGLDPHTLEITPRDAARLADADVLIVNGGGIETWLEPVMQNSGSKALLIEASKDLAFRTPQSGEPSAGHQDETGGASTEHEHEHDPHFWLDPTKVIAYVENIRLGLIQVDPAGEAQYSANASKYVQSLNELDRWIAGQIETIPPERRLIVTNHESFGYYADRYGLRIVGVVLPGPSSLAAPSAEQLAALVQAIRSTGAPAIFLETGASPELAEQVAGETGVQVITGLYTHSLSPQDGPAPSYLEMMRYNTGLIVSALK